MKDIHQLIPALVVVVAAVLIKTARRALGLLDKAMMEALTKIEPLGAVEEAQALLVRLLELGLRGVMAALV